MHLEIAGICFGLSAFMKILSPFSYSNAADIFSTGQIEVPALVLGIVVMAVCVIAAYIRYGKRDLAA